MVSDSVSNQEQLVEINLMEAQYNFDKEQLALEQTHQLANQESTSHNFGLGKNHQSDKDSLTYLDQRFEQN